MSKNLRFAAPWLILLALIALCGVAVTPSFALPIPKADLAVRAASSNLAPAAGDTVIGRVEVRNFGPDDAEGTTVTGNFAGYTFGGFCTPSFPAPAHVLVCTPATPPAGYTCTVDADSFTCTTDGVTDGSRTVIGFTATAGSAPPRISADVSSVTSDPKLSNNHAVAQPTLP